MAVLEGLTDQGALAPVQVTADGRLVAQGLPGAQGPEGPQGPQGPPGPGGGKILSVFWRQSSMPVSQTGGTWTSTGVYVDVTPTAASSSILLLPTCSSVGKEDMGYGWFRITADGAQLAVFEKYAGWTGDVGPNYVGSVSTSWLHVPTYTVGQTIRYEVEFKNAGSTGSINVNQTDSGSGYSTFLAYEIAV